MSQKPLNRDVFYFATQNSETTTRWVGDNTQPKLVYMSDSAQPSKYRENLNSHWVCKQKIAIFTLYNLLKQNKYQLCIF